MMKKFFFGMVVALGLASCSNGGQEANGTVDVAGLGKVKPVFAYYDFSKDEPGCELSGFSFAENFGRWTNADTMSVGVMGEPFSEYTVKFNLNIFYCDEKHTQSEVDVYVNAEKIDHWVLTGESVKYVTLRKDQIAQDGSAKIYFVALNPMSPEQCAGSIDDRRMSFYISNVTLFGFKAE